jgi:hypothetical protein
LTFFKNADDLITLEYQYAAQVQTLGYVLHKNDLGFAPRENLPHRIEDRFNDVLTATARLMKDENEEMLEMFGNFTKCFGYSTSANMKSRSLYRPIDNFGNNLKNPYLGTPNTPYLRIGERNYDDGIRSVRKSVTGVSLPSPRTIMVDVLDKGKLNFQSSRMLLSSFKSFNQKLKRRRTANYSQTLC